MLFSAAVPSAAALEEMTLVPFDSDRFRFDAQEHRIVEHLGRQSLQLQGGVVVLDDVAFTDGVIEFDIAFTGERSFSGVFWRMQDNANFEDFYLRPHQSGFPDATQYTPVFNSVSAWQLYHGTGYSAAVPLQYDRWMHVKLVVSGTQGEIYIDSDEPVLVMHELERGATAGTIGLKASELAPAWFSNFRYEVGRAPALKGTPKPAAPAAEGTVRQWNVSSVFDETALDFHYQLADAPLEALTWSPLASGPTGIANLAELAGVSETANTVLARVNVRSDREQSIRVAFGYSDRVKAYVNGDRVYTGNNGYRSRDYRYLGTIGLFDEIALTLHPGMNELTFAVTEDFGGWGILARFLDTDGVTIVP